MTISYNDFESMMHRADTFRRLGNDADYMSGYMRGLRRLYHGDDFGTAEEHALWMSLAGDETRRDRGQGYRDGFEAKSPRARG